MRFKKIKFNGQKVTLVYERETKDGGWDEYSLSCSDQPLPSFKDALQSLAQDIREMAELPEDYLTRITVTSVSLSYAGEEEVMGAVITGQMLLYHSVVGLNINTPHKPSAPYGEDADPKQLLTEDCVKRIEELIRAAEKYVDGERAQGELFPGKEARA